MLLASPLLQTPQPRGHYVQLYDGDPRPLAGNVARYLAEGLRRQEGAILVTTPEHREMFATELQKLGIDTEDAVRQSSLLVLDAAETLGEFMIDGQPDREHFEKTVRATMGGVKASCPAGLRAYGEMVGVLWTARQYAAAIRLEEFWNTLIGEEGFSLFCSYPIDIFGSDFHISGVDALLCDHTHLIPTGTEAALENALDRAMDDALGSEAAGLKQLIRANYRPAWAVLPAGESTILWLRNNLPRRADNIMRLARRYYDASVAAAS